MVRFLNALKRQTALHKLIKLRQRYVFTKSNHVRLRYVAALIAVTPAMALTIAANDSLRHVNWITEMRNVEVALDNRAHASPDGLAHALAEAAPAAGESESLAEDFIAALTPESQDPGFVEVEVGKGDTLGGVLESAGVGKDESYQVVQAMKEHYNPKDIRPGQMIRVDYEPHADAAPKFTKISMKLSPFEELEVFKDDEKFVSRLEEKELKERTYASKAVIENSLYGSANKAGIPSSVVGEIIRIYSQNTDFQRDIQPGDKIEVLYDVLETEDGIFARTDKVLYANLTVNGRTVPVYRYETADGRVDYFQPDGRSIRKALMKTPIDGARVSSGFGMRKHPVLGYSKMHKGVDFAASRGTPIYAAGNGTVEYAGRFSSYGNYVRIRHNGSIKTAYAHMNGFGKGIRVGSKVSQGQIIGYVGTTGRSTGPHLHYEVISAGRQINPNSMNLPTGEQLAGKDMKNFKDKISSLQQQYVSLSADNRFATMTGRKNSVVR
ncbi:MAG: M23 family metallopeptidase [Alphaproteobacteria bacterium]